MADAAPTKTLDDRLKTLGLVLAALSTVLGLFVAVKTQVISAATSQIDSQVKETQARTAAIDEKLKAQDLRLKTLDERNKTWDSSVRMVTQWHVMNANEFARGLEDGSLNIAWADPKLETLLREAALRWKRHRELMGRGSDDGLLLRQVICLRLLNIGKSSADKLRLLAHVRDFDNERGGQGGMFSEMKARVQGDAPQQLQLGRLMERSQDTKDLPTELVIPVAHVLGSQRYVGRVVVPVGLAWVDERQSKEGSLDISVDDPQLKNRLSSADLGMSR